MCVHRIFAHHLTLTLTLIFSLSECHIQYVFVPVKWNNLQLFEEYGV